MTFYKNPFYNPKVDGKPEYTATPNPVIYKGYEIHERIKKVCYDVVLDGGIVSMRAGINGAKRYIDEISND